MDLLFSLDISLVILLWVLANLSRRIGDALTIPPYYKFFYYQAVLLALVIPFDTIWSQFYEVNDTTMYYTISLSLRVFVVISAFPVAFRYWKWLFTEKP